MTRIGTALMPVHWRIQLLAGSLYWLLSVAGFSFALPPYYITTIWGASGCALAFILSYGLRLFWGVGLGVALANITLLSVVFEQSLFEVRIWMAVLIVTAGVLLQLLVTAWLLLRWVRIDRLSRPGEIAAVLLIAGPVGAIIGTTAGVGVYAWLGSLGESGALNRWFNWWLCDSTGSMLLLAATFVFLQRQRLGRRRTVVVCVPLILLLGVMSAVYHYVRIQETRAQAHNWEMQGQSMVRGMEQFWRAQADVSRVIRSHMELTQNVQRDRFEHFAGAILANDPALVAIGWHPRIDASQRAAFEAQIEREFGENVGTLRINQVGQVMPAEEQQVYYPLHYMRSRYTDGQVSRGIDWASVPGVGPVLAKALNERQPALTPPYWYQFGEADKELFVMLLTPVLTDQCPATINLSSPCVRGFVSLMLRADDIVRLSWGALDPTALRVELSDRMSERLVWQYGEEQTGEPGYLFSAKVQATDRQWQLRLTPASGWLLRTRVPQTWGVLVLLCLAAGLTAWILLLGSGHSIEVRQRIADETSDILNAKQSLEQRLQMLLQSLSYLMPVLRDSFYRQRSSAVELSMREDGLQLDELERLEQQRGDAGNGLRELQWLEFQCALAEPAKSGISPQQVDLEALMELALAQYEPEAQRRGCQLRREFHSVPNLRLESDRLLMVLSAMLDAALEHCSGEVCLVRLQSHMERQRAGVELLLRVRGTTGALGWHWAVAEAWVERWQGMLQRRQEHDMEYRLWLPASY